MSPYEPVDSLAAAAAKALANFLGHHSGGAPLELCLKTLEKEGFSREQIRAAADELAQQERITIALAPGDVTPQLQAARPR